MTPLEARVYAASGLSPVEVRPATMAQVIDTSVHGPAGSIPVRVYVPGRDNGASPSWIVYFHGGGGVIGSIESSDPVSRWLAAATRCTVVSVGYRLGPEAKNPAAIDDAIAAWMAIAERVPPGAKLAVAGDSFGGFLSAHVDRGAVRRPDLQVLIYPMVDLTMSSPSIDRHAEGYLLTRSMMRWFRGHYLGPAQDGRAFSPAFWPDLAGSAPALVVTAGFDPLSDEGAAYAERLRAAGVPVRHRCYPALVHGFMSLGGAVKAAREATDQIWQDIVELLTPRNAAGFRID
jgi:acetyl esterase